MNPDLINLKIVRVLVFFVENANAKGPSLTITAKLKLTKRPSKCYISHE